MRPLFAHTFQGWDHAEVIMRNQAPRRFIYLYEATPVMSPPLLPKSEGFAARAEPFPVFILYYQVAPYRQ